VGAGIGAGAVALNSGDDDADTTVVALATTQLDPLGDNEASGEAEVVGMVPLGVVSPGSQTFELPADLDLGQFPLVDVSVEPLDGDPTHSGVSVARGELDT